MPTYHGIVKGNVIALPEGVDLVDGQHVEVRVAASANGWADEERVEQLDREEEVQQRLLAAGLITEVRRPDSTEPPGDYIPIEIQGKPLSEIIIEERR